MTKHLDRSASLYVHQGAVTDGLFAGP